METVLNETNFKKLIDELNNIVEENKKDAKKLICDEISFMDTMLKVNNDYRRELINEYKSLFSEDIKENNIEKINDIKEKYIKNLVNNIIDYHIKNELLKTIENIEAIDLSTTVGFLNTFKDRIMEENLKDENKSIKEVICEMVTTDLKLK